MLAKVRRDGRENSQQTLADTSPRLRPVDRAQQLLLAPVSEQTKNADWQRGQQHETGQNQIGAEVCPRREA
jgi:hypothetical protein